MHGRDPLGKDAVLRPGEHESRNREEHGREIIDQRDGRPATINTVHPDGSRFPSSPGAVRSRTCASAATKLHGTAW